MKDEANRSTFTTRKVNRDNVYELVRVAALRARQLNQFPHLRIRDQGTTLVDQALREAFDERLDYVLDEGMIDDSEDLVDE